MWKIKYFKSEQKAKQWINDNCHKYQSQLIFVNNGFNVEYRKLIKM